MKLTFKAWEFLHEVKQSLAQILRNQVNFQGKIMSAFDDLQQVAEDAVTAIGKLATSVATIPPAIDKMEARITTILKQVTTPQQLQQVTDAIAKVRSVVTAVDDASTVAAKAAADAADEVDEADVAPTPLADSFASAQALTDAVSVYQAAGGTDGVTLDGTVVGNAGSSTVVKAYFTHSVDGHVDTSGPTD